jgi:hypothetical protein
MGDDTDLIKGPPPGFEGYAAKEERSFNLTRNDFMTTPTTAPPPGFDDQKSIASNERQAQENFFNAFMNADSLFTKPLFSTPETSQQIFNKPLPKPSTDLFPKGISQEF